jgi:hypothetical protein
VKPKHQTKKAMVFPMSSRTLALVAVAFSMLPVQMGQAAEKFQRLSGRQIRARFTGMEVTDSVHFADVYGANGALKSYSMGRKKEGKWRVEKEEICVDRSKDDAGCYQVWISGQNVEFRHEGLSATLEGVLQRPVARN